jgi:hypothetical protein
MKLAKHLPINFFLGLLILFIVKEFTLFNLFMILIGGIIFDIDHFIYHIFSERNLSIAEFSRIHRKLFKSMTPKFYVFHTFEFAAAFLFSVVFFFPILIYFLFGFLIHLFSDIIKYVSYYKSDFSWIKHWSFFWNILNLRKK